MGGSPISENDLVRKKIKFNTTVFEIDQTQRSAIFPYKF